MDIERVAQALPDYEVDDPLARSSWAVVYPGRHRTLGRRVAIKVLLAARGDETVRARFVREARLLARLDHPHIVRIYDFVATEELCAIVVERLTREIPERAAGPQTRADATACAVALAVCAALGQAHRLGVLHRDVKPANILLTDAGVPRLIDFGIAALLGASRTRLTMAGMVVGTPQYMSPEQMQGHPLGPATDVYSTALTLCTLLSPDAGFAGADDPLAAMRRRRRLRRLADVRPDLPPRLVAAVELALADDPARRFGSASSFAHALMDAAVQGWGPAWLSDADVCVDDSAVPTSRQAVPSAGCACGAPVLATDRYCSACGRRLR